MTDAPTREDTDVILERIGAQLLDNLASVILSFIPLLLFGFTAGLLEPQSEALSTLFIGLGFLAFIGVTLGYSAFLEYYWKGQTLGKRAVSIKAVKEDGSQIGARGAVLRNIPILGFIIPYFGLVAYPAALIAIGVNDKRQRLFDSVAGTVVIKEN